MKHSHEICRTQNERTNSGLSVVGGEDSSSNSTASYDEIMRRAKRSKRGDETLSEKKSKKKRVARITLYRNGFTIGDGAFREKSDPVNRRFIESLARGEIPRELEENDKSDERIVVELKDKRLEDYTLPSYVAYGGTWCSNVFERAFRSV